MSTGQRVRCAEAVQLERYLEREEGEEAQVHLTGRSGALGSGRVSRLAVCCIPRALYNGLSTSQAHLEEGVMHGREVGAALPEQRLDLGIVHRELREDEHRVEEHDRQHRHLEAYA